MDSDKIGKFIISLRTEHNLTQKDLAEKLSVTSQAVSKWENGRGIPDVLILKQLSEIFGVDISDILEGEKKNKNNSKKWIIFLGIIILLIVVLIILFFLKKDPFTFSTLASDNDAFTIKGVIAYDKNKKSIYISNVNYDLKDESEYKSIECILYETVNNTENKIAKWDNFHKKDNNTYPLSELLKGIEINVDNYNCSCNKINCNNLYLRINAKTQDNKTVTYNIPLQLSDTCNKK